MVYLLPWRAVQEETGSILPLFCVCCSFDTPYRFPFRFRFSETHQRGTMIMWDDDEMPHRVRMRALAGEKGNQPHVDCDTESRSQRNKSCACLVEKNTSERQSSIHRPACRTESEPAATRIGCVTIRLFSAHTLARSNGVIERRSRRATARHERKAN